MKNTLNHKMLLVLGAAFVLSLAAAKSQVIVVDYQFTGSSTTATTGSSISSLTTVGGISVGGYANWATGTQTGTPYVYFNGSSGAGRSIDISLNATGYQNVTLGNFFQLAAGNTFAAVNWQLSYSTNGGSSFTQIGSNFAVLSTGNSENARIFTGAGFSLGTAANNNANIVFRINSAPGSLDFNGNTALGGQIRLDNFTILATLIPEPGTWTLLAGGLTLVMTRRHRRQR